MNYYEILGLNSNVSAEKIKKDYEKLKEKNKNKTYVILDKKKAKIHLAYSILSEPELKRKYDRQIMGITDPNYDQPTYKKNREDLKKILSTIKLDENKKIISPKSLAKITQTLEALEKYQKSTSGTPEAAAYAEENISWNELGEIIYRGKVDNLIFDLNKLKELLSNKLKNKELEKRKKEIIFEINSHGENLSKEFIKK
jgi:curved DNA-binding protein CbpA